MCISPCGVQLSAAAEPTEACALLANHGCSTQSSREMNSGVTVCLAGRREHKGREAVYAAAMQQRLYTTIENPSYFFMTLSCTEA